VTVAFYEDNIRYEGLADRQASLWPV